MISNITPESFDELRRSLLQYEVNPLDLPNEVLIARAYGLLWLYEGTDQYVHRARKILLSMLNSELQKRGITFAQLEILERKK